jgi:ATP-binding cassette subfamily F protein 3
MTLSTGLTKAVESASALEASRVVMELRLEDKQHDLVEAQKIALRRSGARGKDARAAELAAEQHVKEAEQA